MPIKSTLKKLGLTQVEIAIYLELQKLGESTVSELARVSEIARTTVDENLAKLAERGLITRTTRNNTNLVLAESPAKLKVVTMNRRIELQDEIDEIKRIDDSLNQTIEMIEDLKEKENQKTKIGVKYFVGKSGAKAVYMEAFSAEEMRSYANLGEAHKVFPENGEIFIDAQLRKKSKLIREIIDPSEISIKKAKSYSNNYNFEFKVSDTPANLHAINILMFNGKVAMVNFQGEIVISVLENRDYYENSIALFENLWDSFCKCVVLSDTIYS